MPTKIKSKGKSSEKKTVEGKKTVEEKTTVEEKKTVEEEKPDTPDVNDDESASDFNDSKDDLLADFKLEHEHLTAVRKADPANTCVFCKNYKVNEVNWGPLYRVENAVSHYFCMLFAAGLNQGGDDKQGILGFLPVDIEKEVRRAARLKCIYCHHAGASVGCCDRKCKATFHFPCGLNNKASFQFHGNYESYCINHSPDKDAIRKPAPDHRCPVCLHRIKDSQFYVSGKCCVQSIFHKTCIQRMALSAGYFFKCPTCNAEKFREDMRNQGIFIPEQDAAWEREPNAFQDLLYQYSKCDAKECECPKGPTYACVKGPWQLARCRICGAAGTHRLCSKSKSVANWACAPCLDIETKTDNEKKAVAAIVTPVKATPEPKKSKPAPPNEVEDNPMPSTSAALRKSLAQKKPIKEEGKVDLKREKQVNIGKLFIAAANQDFFPYSKAQLKQISLKRYGIIADWRNQDLFVNLVDIFSDAACFIKEAERRCIENATISRASVAIAPTAPIPKPPENRRKTVDKRPYRRISKWQKGVVKKKDKKPKNRASAKQTVENREEPTLPLNSVAEKEANEPQPSTSSQAILEGIRRSQSTLLRMSMPGNDVASPAIPGPSRSSRFHNDGASPAIPGPSRSSRVHNDAESSAIPGPSRSSRVHNGSASSAIPGPSRSSRVHNDAESSAIPGPSRSSRVHNDSASSSIPGPSRSSRVHSDSASSASPGPSRSSRVHNDSASSAIPGPSRSSRVHSDSASSAIPGPSRSSRVHNDSASLAIPGPSRSSRVHNDDSYPSKLRKLDDRLRVKGNMGKRNDSLPDTTDTNVNNSSAKRTSDSASSSSSCKSSTNLVKSSSHDLPLNHKSLLEGALENKKSLSTTSPTSNQEKSKTAQKKPDENHTSNTNGDQSLDSETSFETANDMDPMDLDSHE